MRIERVDDTTVKLYITYSDIEARGFKKKIYGQTVNAEKSSSGI